MSKSGSSAHFSLREAFERKVEGQTQITDGHEGAESWAMAYLARWAVIEDFAKRLGAIRQHIQLQESLAEWLHYLEAGRAAGNKAPKKIPQGSFDLPADKTKVIPQNNILHAFLPEVTAPVLYELLDADKKYRKRRNKIAHSGEGVSESVYQEFKTKYELAVTEIEVWLKQVVE